MWQKSQHSVANVSFVIILITIIDCLNKRMCFKIAFYRQQQQRLLPQPQQHQQHQPQPQYQQHQLQLLESHPKESMLWRMELQPVSYSNSLLSWMHPTLVIQISIWFLLDHIFRNILFNFLISKHSSDEEKKSLQYKVYNIPGTADKFNGADGTCGNTTQNIVIKFGETSENNTLSLTFKLNATTKEFSLTESVFNLSTNIVPGSDNRTILYYVGKTFEAPKDKSYHCTRVQTLNLTDTDQANANVVGTVSVSGVLVEAFHTGDKQEFSTAVDCDAINTPGMFSFFSFSWGVKVIEFSNELFAFHFRYCANCCWNRIDCFSRCCPHCILGRTSSGRSSWLC